MNEQTLIRRTCKCGCGLKPKPGEFFVKGHQNKGKKFTTKVKRKMSSSHLGKKHSEDTKRKMKESKIGEKNPNYKNSFSASKKFKYSHLGKPLSEKTKEKIALTKRGDKNPNYKRIYSEKERRRFGSPMEKNPNWKGGISFLPYPTTFNNRLKQSIKDRDNNECQNPYCDHRARKLDVHHIDYDKENCSQFNLISLCSRCHSKANANRNEWRHFYKKIVWSKYE